MCGEKALLTLPRLPVKGSPPRVRGKARFSRLRWLHERITPACAGKRPFGCAGNEVLKDHPRVCGEK